MNRFFHEAIGGAMEGVRKNGCSRFHARYMTYLQPESDKAVRLLKSSWNFLKNLSNDCHNIYKEFKMAFGSGFLQ